MTNYLLFVIKLCVVALLVVGCGETERVVPTLSPLTEINGETMGTTYSVKASINSPALSEIDLQAEIESVLKLVNDQMSTYQADSELSRFNSGESTDWLSVSPETVSVVREALHLAELSEGAFDPTVGPLVNLWHFGPDKDGIELPDDKQIAATMERVGYSSLLVRDEPPALRKKIENVYLDLSAIAKGHGVDRVADLLESNGITNYLVEIGGEMRASGAKPNGTLWNIGIESPTPGERRIHTRITLRDASLATSGDYRNFFEHEGTRYSHTIDPRTGRPVSHSLTSVSVVANSCTLADAWATTLMVLGPEEGYNLAEKHGVAALMLIYQGEELVERHTTAFTELQNP